MTDRSLSAIVLAAGAGTRMKSARPKPLHMLAGRSMLHYVIDSLADCAVGRIVVVVGHGAERVTKKFQSQDLDTHLTFVEQVTQDGTGDATSVGLTGLPDDDGPDADDHDVLVLAGDMPLLRSSTIAALVESHRANDAACTVLTAVLDDAGSYGRIVRGKDGNVVKIVEAVDAAAQRLDIGDRGALVHAQHDHRHLAEDLHGLLDRPRRHRGPRQRLLATGHQHRATVDGPTDHRRRLGRRRLAVRSRHHQHRTLGPRGQDRRGPAPQTALALLDHGEPLALASLVEAAQLRHPADRDHAQRPHPQRQRRGKGVAVEVGDRRPLRRLLDPGGGIGPELMKMLKLGLGRQRRLLAPAPGPHARQGHGPHRRPRQAMAVDGGHRPRLGHPRREQLEHEADHAADHEAARR